MKEATLARCVVRNDRRFQLMGVWIPIVSMLIFGFTFHPYSPYLSWVHHVLGLPPRDGSAKSHLVETVANSISTGSGLLLILMLVALTWKRWGHWSTTAVILVPMLFVQIATAVAILWRCLNLVGQAEAKWVTGDLVLEVESGWAGMYVWLALCGCLLAADVVRQFGAGRSNCADRGKPADSEQ